MAVFEYRATGAAGNRIRGILSADSPRAARDRLRGDGLSVQLLQEKAPQGAGWSLSWMSAPSPSRWTEAAHELATLLAGGVPLLDGLDTVARQSQGSLRRILLDIRDRVAAGTSLAGALSEHPNLFDELSVRMVEVGENAGNLDIALQRLADFRQRWQDLKDRVASALIYPLFVFTFGTAATLFLMTHVMPPLLDNLKETLEELPWPTRLVKAGSDLLLTQGYLVAIVAALLFVIGSVAFRSPRIRLLLDHLLLRLPIFGQLCLKQGLSRVALILSTLLRSGLPLAAGLELATNSTANRVLKRALANCREALIAGRDLSAALAESGVIPPFAIQIFSVGQESGQLEEMLTRLSENYDRQVQVAAGRLAAVMEPVLILVLAAMIGFVLLAIVMPILEAGNVAM